MDRLVKIPVVQATLQAEVLSLIGNSIAQLINGWGKDDVSFDWKVLGLSLVVQLVMVPPNFHWQLFLEKQFPAQISTEKCKSPHPSPLSRGVYPLTSAGKGKANAGATSRRLDEDDALETGNAANDPLLDSDEGSIVESPTRLSFRNTFIKCKVSCRFPLNASIGPVRHDVDFLSSVP